MPNAFAQAEKSHLRPLERHRDSTVIISDSGKSAAMIKRMKAALEAQDKPEMKLLEVKQKSWYEYINVKTWVILGLAGVFLLGWIWRTFIK